MTDDVSRHEFAALQRRVDDMDRSGTRGVAVLALQVQELSKDFAKHELAHDEERRARASNRKWVAMLIIAVIAAVDGPIVAVLLATHG
jgi:hypothetical protein